MIDMDRLSSVDIFVLCAAIVLLLLGIPESSLGKLFVLTEYRLSSCVRRTLEPASPLSAIVACQSRWVFLYRQPRRDAAKQAESRCDTTVVKHTSKE